MGQFSMTISTVAGSVLGDNQQDQFITKITPVLPKRCSPLAGIFLACTFILPGCMLMIEDEFGASFNHMIINVFFRYVLAD